MKISDFTFLQPDGAHERALLADLTGYIAGFTFRDGRRSFNNFYYDRSTFRQCHAYFDLFDAIYAVDGPDGDYFELKLTMEQLLNKIEANPIGNLPLWEDALDTALEVAAFDTRGAEAEIFGHRIPKSLSDILQTHGLWQCGGAIHDSLLWLMFEHSWQPSLDRAMAADQKRAGAMVIAVADNFLAHAPDELWDSEVSHRNGFRVIRTKWRPTRWHSEVEMRRRSTFPTADAFSMRVMEYLERDRSEELNRKLTKR